MKYLDLIDIGGQRMAIAYKIDGLIEKARFQFYQFTRINELGKLDDAEHRESSLISIKQYVSSQVKDINSDIDRYNEASASILNGKTMRKVSIKPIVKEIERLFNKPNLDSESYKELSPHLQKQFVDFLTRTFDAVFDDLVEHKKDLEGFKLSFKLNTYPDDFYDDLVQVVDIYALGYKSTSLLVLGRVFEKLFTVWGNKLIVDEKLNKTKDELEQLRFENLLGLFKSEKLITEKEWYILSKLRLDRNLGGHYLSDEDALLRTEAEEEAEYTLQLAMPIIKKFIKSTRPIKNNFYYIKLTHRHYVCLIRLSYSID